MCSTGSRAPKELPPKHFYDARGAELFDRICELPEYYPTRAEREILEEQAEVLAELTGSGELVELGSGTAAKTRAAARLAATPPARSSATSPSTSPRAWLRDCAQRSPAPTRALRVHGLIGDFERHLDRVPPAAGPRVVAFLGGTIGNFPPGSRRRVLRQIARLLSPSDHLLMGTDLVKDPRVLRPPTTTPKGSPPSSTATSCA